MAKKDDFNSAVPLPPGLEVSAIRRAIEYMERELADLVEIYCDQANVFRAIVGIFGAKALDSVSSYEKHRNIDTAQQRFPDLRRRGAGKKLTPKESLESKGSKRPWAIQSHYDHPGWYVIWRYLIDPTESLERGKPVFIWRVDVAFHDKRDWKYEKSTAGTAGGGRTHAFGVKNPAKKLNDKAVYHRRDIFVRDGKAVPRNGDNDWPEQRIRSRSQIKPRNAGLTWTISTPWSTACSPIPEGALARLVAGPCPIDKIAYNGGTAGFTA